MMNLNTFTIALIACSASLFASPDQPVVEPIEVTKTYAENGDPVAQFNLGIRYGKGEGVAKDSAEALRWYKKSAVAGFAQAQFNLGVIYANGEAVPRDEKEALKWLTMAGEMGLFEAQKLLIEFHSEGRGGPKNPAAALEWDFLARRTLALRHGQPAGEPPHPPVLRKDGSAELIVNGVKRIMHPGGGEEENAQVNGVRVINFKDGRKKTIGPDGMEATTHPDGFVNTIYPDGRKSVRDPKGVTAMTYPDGRKDMLATSTDKYARSIHVTENYDKEGKRIGRIIVRGKRTVYENASGPVSVETLAEDVYRVKMKITEEVLPDGSLGKRTLSRLKDGVGPKGSELWKVRREIEPGEDIVVVVEETFSSEGFYSQSVISKSKISAPPSTVRYSGGNSGRMFSAEVMKIPQAPVTFTPTELHRNLSGPSVFNEKVNLAPMFKELGELELKGLHFAGATDADWSKAKARAAAYLIPLAVVPQKKGTSPSWLAAKQITGSTLPVFPFQRTSDDFSRQYPLGFHGRDVIKAYPWKHAQTPHFIVHYIEDSDAVQCMQFIEGAYHVMGNLLGLDAQRGSQKGHVYLFPNEKDWRSYLATSGNSVRLGGFAYKNELLLPSVTEREGREESIKTLCHEVTHAIVSRFYPGAKPPLWLNEGIAEYIAAVTIAAKRTHPVEKYMSSHADSPMTVDEVFQRVRYGMDGPRALFGGSSRDSVAVFYANSAWCVRTLCEKLPPEGFPRFFNALSAGNSPDAAFAFAYGAKCADTKAFETLVNLWKIPKPATKAK